MPAIPLAHVTKLTLGLPLSVKQTHALLRRASSVTTLIATAGRELSSNQCCDFVCRVLGDPTSYREGSFLPALETLSLHEAPSFNYPKTEITQALEMRAASGCSGPHTLRLTGCASMTRHVETWTRWVDVRENEVEYEFTDSEVPRVHP